MLDWGALMALAIAMNKATYEAMTPEQQTIVDTLGSEMNDVYAQNLTATNGTSIEDLKAEGKISFSSFADSQKEQLLTASKSYWDDWKDKASAAGRCWPTIQRC